MQDMRIQSLVRGLRSHMPPSVIKKTKIKQSNSLSPIKKAMLYKKSAGLEMEALSGSSCTNSLRPVPSSVTWILFSTLPSLQELAGSGGKVEL